MNYLLKGVKVVFTRTDDPIADAEQYNAEQERKLEKLPKCAECGHPIQQDDAVCIKGKFYCDTCLDDLRESVGDY